MYKHKNINFELCRYPIEFIDDRQVFIDDSITVKLILKTDLIKEKVISSIEIPIKNSGEKDYI